MYKVTVTHEFNLPEDRDEHRTLMNAGAYYCALTEFGEALRSAAKYGQYGMVTFSDDEYKTIEKLRDLFHGVLIDNGVEL